MGLKNNSHSYSEEKVDTQIRNVRYDDARLNRNLT